MPIGGPALVSAVVPMVAADEWGSSVVYETVGGASVLTLPFILDMDGALGRADFSLRGERHGGGRLNVGEDTESMTVAGAEWDVDGNTGANGRPVD